MADKKNLLARLTGWGFVGLGSAVLARPVQFGNFLGIDVKKKPGLALVLILALRDVITGLQIIRAKDGASLRRWLAIRMACDSGDFFMHLFGRGIIIQPKARRIAPGVPLAVLVIFLIRRNVKD